MKDSVLFTFFLRCLCQKIEPLVHLMGGEGEGEGAVMLHIIQYTSNSQAIHVHIILMYIHISNVTKCQATTPYLLSIPSRNCCSHCTSLERDLENAGIVYSTCAQ